MCVHFHIQYIIDQNLHDEDIQRIKMSMEVEDIQWIKISIMAEDIWHILESSHKSWNIMNTGMNKEVAYMRCHQSGMSSTQIAMSTCPTMWIEVSRSNIVVHRLITGHWCIPLTYVRYTTDNDNGNQGIECNKKSVNKCVEVEHLKESIDQGTLMYSQNFQWR